MIIHCIDLQTNQMINTILHHRIFQKLEASWRGLYYLTHLNFHQKNASTAKIKILSMTWNELKKDFYRVTEFEQSQLFIKVYNQEFDQPGGEPFGLLVGDYSIADLSSHKNDILTLRSIAKVTAAAFTPFIASLAPDFFGLEDISQLERPIDLYRILQQPQFRDWHSLRQDETAYFIGLLLPDVLRRLPYHHHKVIPFTEKITHINDYLWGNPAYCFAANVLRTFQHTGWFLEIIGLAEDTAGLRTTDLSSFSTNSTFPIGKPKVNVAFTDNQEKTVCDLGFTPLCSTEKKHMLVFYDCPSIKKSAQLKRKSRINDFSTSLHYILCASRFAHYLKIITRNKIGSFCSPKECEEYLQNWLLQYAATGAGLSEEMRAKYPLRYGKVTVSEQVGKIGCWLCIMHLTPHHPFHQIETYLQFNTELNRAA